VTVTICTRLIKFDSVDRLEPRFHRQTPRSYRRMSTEPAEATATCSGLQSRLLCRGKSKSQRYGLRYRFTFSSKLRPSAMFSSGCTFPLEIMLVCVRWYAAYASSLRNLAETMAERVAAIDHIMVHCWALKVLPALFRAVDRLGDGFPAHVEVGRRRLPHDSQGSVGRPRRPSLARS
jgi:hypothetical protein